MTNKKSPSEESFSCLNYATPVFFKRAWLVWVCLAFMSPKSDGCGKRGCCKINLVDEFEDYALVDQFTDHSHSNFLLGTFTFNGYFINRFSWKLYLECEDDKSHTRWWCLSCSSHTLTHFFILLLSLKRKFTPSTLPPLTCQTFLRL